MTIAQANRFYEQDLKKYDLLRNKEFLTWFNNLIKNGYHCFISVEELQNFIDNIVSWYEIKYPEREMEFYEGTRYYNFENIIPLSKHMNIEQLLYRLPHKQFCLMECNYRSMGGGITTRYNEDGNITQQAVVFMNILKKDIEFNPFSDELSDFLIHAFSKDGKVLMDSNIKEYANFDNITLDELLVLFKEKYADKLDFTKLEECIFDHNCDIELRNKILQLIALKLLYSPNTIPERGYERAKRFINEFNKKLALNISSKEIDEIFNRDYTNGEKWEHVLKTYVDEFGEKQYYWTIENKSEKQNGLSRLFSKKQ